MKRIAITGSHGVGKTTLAQALANDSELGEVELSSQIARTLIKKGYPLGRDATAESYIQYIIAQLRAEQAHKDCDVFISDRTLLDPLAYAVVNREFVGATVPNSIIELLMRVWALEKQQYDLYVFVPIEFDMQNDGVRPEGDEYRAQIDAEMLALLNEFDVNYIAVSGSPEKRHAQVIDALKKVNNGRS